MKRLLIENDSKIDLSRIKHYIKDMGYNSDTFFNETIIEATMNGLETWAAIKRADEIYAESSLIDFMGISGGTLFNGMMYRAIEENVTDKKMFFFSNYEDIWWDNLNADLVDKAFRKNYLYVMSKNWPGWEQVDIDKLIKDKL